MFNINFEPETYTIEVHIGNQIVENQRFSAPPMLANNQFMQNVDAIAKDVRPMMIKITKQTSNNISEIIEFRNNNYIKAFGEFVQQTV